MVADMLVMFFGTVNNCPHLETSFELALRHLEKGDSVVYYFLGRKVPYSDFMSAHRPPRLLTKWCLPEERAARLIRHRNFKYISDARVAVPEIEPPATLSALMALEYRGFQLGMAVASSLISLTGNSQFDPSHNLDLVAAALSSGAAIYDFVGEVLRARRPDLVYVFNGRFCNESAVLRACEVEKISYLIHERGSDKDRFSLRPYIPHDRAAFQKDALESWQASQGEAAESAARKWFEDQRAGRERGWTSFIQGQSPNVLPELDANARIVSYFSSSDDEFVAVRDEFRWEGWKDQLDAVLGLINICEDIPGCQLVIRLHPHLARKHALDRERWLRLRDATKRSVVVMPESPVDTYALLDRSDVVVTSGSTVGIEAVYWGKPSILLGPSMYDRVGAVHLARKSGGLAAFAFEGKILLVDPAKSMPYGYYLATFGQRYRHFEPDSLFSGRLLGANIQRKPNKFVRRIIKIAKALAVNRHATAAM